MSPEPHTPFFSTGGAVIGQSSSMCCFSTPVNSVAATRIFGRFVEPDRQAGICQMRLDAPEDLAMILPIPVARPAADDAVKFVDTDKAKDLVAPGDHVCRRSVHGLQVNAEVFGDVKRLGL